MKKEVRLKERECKEERRNIEREIRESKEEQVRMTEKMRK